jgi:GT2 family glycosyltransferase
VDLDVSVIIPTYNRGDALIETLTALNGCEYPRERFEVIVVDDGSTDGTAEAVRQFNADRADRIRFHEQPNAGPARARNQGAALARGRTLIFIDNDIVVEPDFVRRHMDAGAAHPGCWIVGRIRHPAKLRETPFGRYRDDLWEAFHQSHDPNEPTETDGITAANISLPAADFRRLGGFDERFTIASCEDWELGMRARREGIRVLYDPSIVVLHNDWAVDLRRFCERQRLYSISDVLLWRMYGDASPRVAMIRQNVPGGDARSKKFVKRVLATGPGRALLRGATRISEVLTGDGGITRRFYNAAIGAAIFRGVREGIERYREDEMNLSTNNHEWADTNTHE